MFAVVCEETHLSTGGTVASKVARIHYCMGEDGYIGREDDWRFEAELRAIEHLEGIAREAFRSWLVDGTIVALGMPDGKAVSLTPIRNREWVLLTFDPHLARAWSDAQVYSEVRFIPRAAVASDKATKALVDARSRFEEMKEVRSSAVKIERPCQPALAERAPVRRERPVGELVRGTIDALERENGITPSTSEVVAYLLAGRDKTGLVIKVVGKDIHLDGTIINRAHIVKAYKRIFRIGYAPTDGR